MIFKEIDVAGFKSFADKLEIKFDSGITAIVGPNGCGKSNVADAIRWVLGEQSSKLLRGSSMQDVIFKGTQKRKSLSYCEVSLVFDNTTKIFNIDYDEVVLTRKLYRSGNSEYLINKNNVRLKDITDLLHDSGIGKEGYSIIGQGRVEQIISSKPEDRRGIFEEAAGIAKFKARKIDAERKLERTHENLTRLNDIIAEIERQVGPLKTQSENAKKYLDFKSELKNHEVNLYINQYDSASESRQKIKDVIAGLDQELALREGELNSVIKKYNDNMDALRKFDDDIKSLNEQILNVSLKIQKFSSDNTLLKERINFLNEQVNRSESQANAFSEEISFNEKVTKDNSDKIAELKVELAQMENQEKELTNKYLKIVGELTQSEDANEEANNQVINALERLTDIKANTSKLSTEKDVLLRLNDENQGKINALKEKIVTNEEQINIINRENSDVDEKKSALEEFTANAKNTLADLDFKIRLAERDLGESKTRLQVSTNRKNMISDLQADFEGYAGSVKRLLQDANANSVLSGNIVGVVAQCIKVPARLETAMEVALGSALQNIITKNEDDAKVLINYLKEKKYGRATFLPLNSIKPRNIDSKYMSAIKSNGILGVANTLIEFDTSLSRVFEGLLGATVIAEDLDCAVDLSKKCNYAFKVVTLEGDVINPAGSLTGGSKKSEATNLLSRDREIERLTEEIVALNKKIGELQLNLDKLNYERNNLATEYEAKSKELNSIKVDFAGVFEKRARFEDFNNRLNEEIISIQNEIEKSIIRIKYIEDELKSADELETTLTNARISAGETNKARQEVFDSLKEQKENYNKSTTDLRIKIVSLESDIRALENDNERLEAENKELSDKITFEQKAIETNKKAIKDMFATSEGGANAEKQEKYEKQLEEVRFKVAKLEQGKVDIQEDMKTLDTKRSGLTDNINVLNKKRMTQEMNLQRVDSDLQSMQDRIYEEYSLTYETCLPLKQADYDVSNGYKIVAEIKREINKLGSINVNAIEEYKLVSGRYEEMSEQANDLIKAEEEFKQIISELSNEMTTIFNEKFNIINQNFTKIFSQLFGGGSARLELLESDDPLNAGVDIVAEPPGKKLQAMTLMSGGEKTLTAIAILFAILKLRPMPFCLLDEIEAALDDANITRFANYLKKFSNETQFIVITHRKPTMELADSLYGVTMEEKGVSKIVSVKLADAIKNSTEG